ncbi:MAG: KEOPS complex subunit Pcc1 [Candidatus Helarchaeota archaeon]
MNNLIESTISFHAKNVGDAQAYYNSLELETLTSASDRVSVALEKLDLKITIKFMAKDFVALRAAMNSYLRWFKLISEIVDL